MATLQDKFSKALDLRGFKEETTSRKYRTFVNPANGSRYYVGKAGSVRRGRVYTESAPLTEGAKAMLLSEVGGN